MSLLLLLPPGSTGDPTAIVEIDFTTNLAGSISYGEQALMSAPYVHYRLRETSGTAPQDASGNDRDGTLEGTTTLDQSTGNPVTGEAAARHILLGGGNAGAAPGRVKLTGTALQDNRLTIEAFVYLDTLGTGADVRRIFDSGSTLFTMRVWVDSAGKVKTKFGVFEAETTAAEIAAATWYHLTVTIDGTAAAVKVYVNGVSKAVTATANPLARFGLSFSGLFTETAGRTWYFGTATNTANIYPVQRIAEPAVYTRLLTGAEITDHYAARATAPFPGYTWTDVSPYQLGTITRKMGRPGQLADVVPSELNMTLKNDDRRFEPGNTASPYSPNVVPGRPVRVRLRQAGYWTYDWYFGFVEGWPQVWDAQVQMCRVPLQASCYLAKLNQEELGSREYAEQLAGPRVAAILNAAGQPTSMRSLDAGSGGVMTQTLDQGATAGAFAQTVARTDRGLLYFDPAGNAVFQDGNHRSTDSRSTTARGTLGNLAGEINYARPEIDDGEELIFNEITLRRPGGVDQTAVDQTSRNKHGKRSLGAEVLLLTDSATLTRAEDLLTKYKDPKFRIRSVTIYPAKESAWVEVLGARVSDRWTWKFRPAQGLEKSMDVFIEGTIDTLAPGNASSTVWVLSEA